MRVLLTGSSGYIASKLLPHLLKRGYEVVGVDREPNPHGELVQFVHGDLTDAAVAEAAVEDVELVLHLAAAKGDWGISEEEFYQDNLVATEVLLQAGRAQGIKDWFFYSTVSAMGPSTEAIDESAPLNPVIPYGASKAKAEQRFMTFSAEEPDARIAILRPSVVFGPDNPDNTNIYRLIEAIRTRRFVMIGRGEAVKTTSYVGNLVEANLFMMDRMVPGVQTHIYVDEPALSTGELATKIYQLLGMKQPSWHLPLWLAAPIAYVADAAAVVTGIDFPITAARIKKFNTSTFFSGRAIRERSFTQPFSMDDALEATVKWHMNAVADTPKQNHVPV